MASSLFVAVNAEDQPRYGGILRIRHRGNPISFNGFLNYWSTSRDLHQQVYNRLITVDADRNLVPDLAKSWEVLDDGKKFVFHLYDNVTWHDGMPFTSADVKWHWETLADPEVVTYVKPKLATLVSVEAPDPYTVEFTFSEPTQAILFAYFQSDTYIHPKHLFEGKDLETNPANFKPVGTGPFIVTDFDPPSYCTMVANENYFKGRPYLDGLVWKIIPDSSAGLIAFEAGEVDLTSPPKEELPRLQEDPSIGLRWGQSSGTHRLTFNYRDEAIAAHPWVAEVTVRQAIAHAINKQLLVDRVQKGLATVAHTGMGAGAGAWVNQDVQKYEYDPAKANELLDAAGYPKDSSGVRFEIPFITYDRDYSIQASEIIKEMLKEVGITMDIIPVEYITYVALYEHGENGMEDYPVTYNHMGGWPPEEIGSWMHGKPEGGMNMGYYDNPEVDALLDEGYVTMDPAERKVIYDEVQAINAVELPYIHLYSTEGAVVYNADFMNMESTRAVTSWKAYDDVWWIKGELPPEPEPEPEPEPPVSGDVEERVESLESASQSLSSDISSLENQVSSLSMEISELKSQPAASANNTMSYIAILIALVAIGVAYYFGTQK
jgi:peptide/nickel transport system substrate-binding protein